MKVQPQLLSSSSLTSNDVKNAQGEDLGHVEDFMIDLASGRVAYAVLSFGGVLGIGNKLFALPWQSLSVDTNDECFILNVPKERLENAPGFDKNNWPDMSNREWRSKVYAHYDVQPDW